MVRCGSSLSTVGSMITLALLPLGTSTGTRLITRQPPRCSGAQTSQHCARPGWAPTPITRTVGILAENSVLGTVGLTIAGAKGMTTALMTEATTLDLTIITGGAEMTLSMKTGIVKAGATIMITEERTTERASGARHGINKHSVGFKELYGKLKSVSN